MSWFVRMFTSSLGKKYVMALTGLFLCSFLVIHLSGNLLLFLPDNGHAFNSFTYFMEHNILISVLSYVLFAGFIIHIIQSYVITRRNAAARPVKYAVVDAKANSTWSSRNMGILGSLVFLFLVIHLRDFFYDLKFTDEIADDRQNKVIVLYPDVVHAFQLWYYSLIYVIGVIALGYHLWHGFQSGFRSLGIVNKKYMPAIIWVGKAYTLIITIGFVAMPIYFYLVQFFK